jgi:hypothetical protein
MANVFHSDVIQGDIHVPYQWVYADATARNAATGFVSSDVGKLALQSNHNSLWMLTATTPTWQGLALTIGDLPSDATKYLDGTGAYSVPAGGGGGGGSSVLEVQVFS